MREGEAMEKILRPKAKKQQGTRTDICQNLDKSIDTKKEVAKHIGTSHGTLHKVKSIADKDPELLKDIDSGKKTVHKVTLLMLR